MAARASGGRTCRRRLRPHGARVAESGEQVSIIGATIGRRIQFEELSPEEFRRETAGRWPRPVVDMLLAAWAATIGRPAFMTYRGRRRRIAAAHLWPVGRRCTDAFLRTPASDEV